jgi:hypothetical protein
MQRPHSQSPDFKATSNSESSELKNIFLEKLSNAFKVFKTPALQQ